MRNFYKLSKKNLLNDNITLANQKFALVSKFHKRICFLSELWGLQSYILSNPNFNYEKSGIFENSLTTIQVDPTCMKIYNVSRLSLFTKLSSSTSSYIIYVKILLSNIYLVICTPFGKTLIRLSAGSKIYRGKQKTSKIVLNEMIKKLIVKSRALKKTGIFLMVLKGIKRHRSSIIIRLKDIYPIRAIYVNNLKSHNGCRAKKTRKK